MSDQPHDNPQPAADKRAKANLEVLTRYNEGEPVLVDILPAIDAVPGMTANTS